MKTCESCAQQFEVTSDDREFFKKFDVSDPTLCPDCRQKRRLSHRNERCLYRRKCDLSGRDIITTYSPDKPLKVYGTEEWWSDNWDPLEYGQDYDPTRPFFEQILELSKKTPRPPLINFNSENSLYTSHSGHNKNCYMCINVAKNEDCYYITNFCIYNKDCVDCLAIHHCELCYFCTDTRNSSFSEFLDECRHCNNCMFCYDCHSCSDCFGCFNLRHKKHYIFNKPYSQEEYEKKIKEIRPTTWLETVKAFSHFKELLKENAIFKYAKTENCQDCIGDHITGSKNVKNSYYGYDTEDAAYCYDFGEMKMIWDVTEPWKGELQYETHACNEVYNGMGDSKCYECNNVFYSQYCWYSNNIFGCFGLKRKENCILNKQYSPEEYEKLRAQIIENMKKSGEWGEFFPMEHSPYCYNETAAHEYCPLTKETAPSWYEGEDTASKDAGDASKCDTCGKSFRIIPQEAELYGRKKLPLPGACPDCRHKMRMGLRPPRKLQKGSCGKCGVEIETVFGDKKNVCCEKCYLETVY
ncbi:MAG: hypothetical protein ABII07_00550 [Patescibacteria group bacterium]|nr:zinc-ribbon domain-containing protein [Patescibacteria group bacterium]